MPTYHVTAEFDLNITDLEAVQERARQAFLNMITTFGGAFTNLLPGVETPEQAAASASENTAMALSMLVKDVVAFGVSAAFPPGTTAANLQIQNDAPSPPLQAP